MCSKVVYSIKGIVSLCANKGQDPSFFNCPRTYRSSIVGSYGLGVRENKTISVCVCNNKNTAKSRRLFPSMYVSKYRSGLQV